MLSTFRSAFYFEIEIVFGVTFTFGLIQPKDLDFTNNSLVTNMYKSFSSLAI